MKTIRKGVLMAFLISLISGCRTLRSEWIVGKDIKKEDITEFYYTDSATTNPPRFQRYHFYVENGIYLFTHEKREGEDIFPTEKDITETGSLELTEEEWNKFFELINSGVVTKRSDITNLNDGTSKDLFLYWNNDKNDSQVFNFESSNKMLEFEKYCLVLKEKEIQMQ